MPITISGIPYLSLRSVFAFCFVFVGQPVSNYVRYEPESDYVTRLSLKLFPSAKRLRRAAVGCN